MIALWLALAFSAGWLAAMLGVLLTIRDRGRNRRGGYVAGPFLGRDPERLARELEGRRGWWGGRLR